MDWSYSLFVLGQGAIAFAALLVPVPFLAMAASKGRVVPAALPGLAGSICFLVFALLAACTSVDSPRFLGYLPLVGFVFTLSLLPASIRSLRRKWVGLLHLATVAGVLLSCFVAGMAVSHDWL